GAGNSALRVPHSAFVWLHCAWKTGYTVTLLSISNLAGYKSVTPQLHGYIVVTQQLSLETSVLRCFQRNRSRPGHPGKTGSVASFEPLLFCRTFKTLPFSASMACLLNARLLQCNQPGANPPPN